MRQEARVLLLATAPLLTDQHHRNAAQVANAADHRRIVQAEPVAAQLDELRHHRLNVVTRRRPLGMTSKLDRLPG